jgi:hypothetical protein
MTPFSTSITSMTVTGVPGPEKYNMTAKPKIHASFLLSSSGIVSLSHAEAEIQVIQYVPVGKKGTFLLFKLYINVHYLYQAIPRRRRHLQLQRQQVKNRRKQTRKPTMHKVKMQMLTLQVKIPTQKRRVPVHQVKKKRERNRMIWKRIQKPVLKARRIQRVSPFLLM